MSHEHTVSFGGGGEGGCQCTYGTARMNLISPHQCFIHKSLYKGVTLSAYVCRGLMLHMHYSLFVVRNTV